MNSLAQHREGRGGPRAEPGGSSGPPAGSAAPRKVLRSRSESLTGDKLLPRTIKVPPGAASSELALGGPSHGERQGGWAE